MIKFEKTEVVGWEPAIRGMRNPKNSWDKSDSLFEETKDFDPDDYPCNFKLGPKDWELMVNLRNAGPDHRKFMRMIIVYVDITAPLYWWKEFDTYKVGTVANSCSTMHKLGEKEFTLDDFSHEHLSYSEESEFYTTFSFGVEGYINAGRLLELTIKALNFYRKQYLFAKEKLKRKDLTPSERNHTKAQMKHFWWQMIQLLPSSYNQKRTIMFNYEVLANQYKSREFHKLDEWAKHNDGSYYGLCDWIINELPYSELITGPALKNIPISKEIMEEAKRRVRDELASDESILFVKK